MYWKLNKSLPSEKEKRLPTQYSRASDHSTIAIDSNVNVSLDLDSSFNDSYLHNTNHLFSVTTPIRAKITERKTRMGKSEQIKRNYLQRVLMNRMINIRLAFKNFEELPVTLFKPSLSYDIARELVMKTQLNMETSIMRTLLYSRENKKKQTSGQIKLQRGQNIFVLPTPSDIEAKRQAIVKLAEVMNSYKRFAVKQFELHYKICHSKARYLSKLCCIYQQSRKVAMLKFKLLPNRNSLSPLAQQQVQNTKLQLALSAISSKILQLEMISLQNLKTNSWACQYKQKEIAKKIILFSKIKREQAVWAWRRKANSQIQIEKEQVRVEQAKIDALSRIVVRNYFKLFREINRRLFNFRKVAVRLGSYSKINEQKSLWRLLTNIQHPTALTARSSIA